MSSNNYICAEIDYILTAVATKLNIYESGNNHLEFKIITYL